MSLVLNESPQSQWKIPEAASIDDMREAALLDRYLAIMETNKRSSRFAPDDALLALDMAGFVAGAIRGSGIPRPQVSMKRLAMALVQPMAQAAPLQ